MILRARMIIFTLTRIPFFALILKITSLFRLTNINFFVIINFFKKFKNFNF